MTYSDIVAADQRLTILRLLAEDADYAHNEFVLRRLCAEVGHDMSQDVQRGHFAWLAEQGLIDLIEAADIQTAKLTARGEDVARGRARIPGIARPHP